ncbi:MAG: hypothetical protein RL179_1528 [Planctomycetota bacterium]|jgi:FtsH-binding integral membrane protein
MQYDSEFQEMTYSGTARLSFIRKTYAHLAGAVLGFVVLETLLLNTITEQQIMSVFGRSSWAPLIIMLAFWGASYVAQMLAQSDSSPAIQYAGLGLYVVAESLIFLPILYIATHYINDKSLIPAAGALTMCVFAGLTISVFATGKDYSFLAPALSVGSMLILGLIVCSLIFGFSLGLIFSFAMVGFMSGYILYETSLVMLHFPTDKHVAAALMLFSSVATLFFYILRILMAFNSRD